MLPFRPLPAPPRMGERMWFITVTPIAGNSLSTR